MDVSDLERNRLARQAVAELQQASGEKGLGEAPLALGSWWAGGVPAACSLGFNCQCKPSGRLSFIG